tara:strand:- start:114 stop:500 length:387 start_codon:yes stop_codon:yes gene_type:complete
MAEGFAKNILSEEYCLIESAGLRADGLNKNAVIVMHEVEVDISNQKSKNISSVDLNAFDLVVTVCDNARDNCPVVTHNKVIHKQFDDPAVVGGKINNQLLIYREVRDQIQNMVQKLIKNYDKICQEQN